MSRWSFNSAGINKYKLIRWPYDDGHCLILFTSVFINNHTWPCDQVRIYILLVWCFYVTSKNMLIQCHTHTRYSFINLWLKIILKTDCYCPKNSWIEEFFYILIHCVMKKSENVPLSSSSTKIHIVFSVFFV